MNTHHIAGIAQVLLSAASTAAVVGLWIPNPELLALILALQSAFGGATSLKQAGNGDN